MLGDQGASVSVCDATYFGSPFIRSVNGSSGSVIWGHASANAS